MTRKLLSLILCFLLLVFVSTVNAQTATIGSTPTLSTVNTKTATNAATKLKLQMQLIQDQKREAINKVKEDAKALIQTKREEFKTKIQTIRDQKKKTLVQRIDTKLAEVNEKQTTKYSEALVRLQGFLDKIKQSTTSATILTDISAAQTAIDTAKAAVETQAAKTYIMTITDDAKLKLNAGATVSQLRLDLSGVYRLVINAKQTVQKLHTEKPKLEKEATKSGEL